MTLRYIRKNTLYLIIFVMLFSYVCFLFFLNNNTDEEYVNVYGWYGIIPRSVIKDFEKETGICVRYDIYDNNETLEAKLLATSSGYDVVFPSLCPYGTRQLPIGAYQKLDEKLIPNLKNLNKDIRSKFIDVVGNTNILVPFSWGCIGIIFDADVIKDLLPNDPLDSYGIIFEKENVEKLWKHGVSLPEEFTDIFLSTQRYLKIDHTKKDKKNLDASINLLRKIRNYIKKFSSTTIISDILNGDVCIGMGSSDNAYRAIREGKKAGRMIRFFIPKEGASLWIDCICIPSSAKNVVSAHKFINFLLRKDIAARITNYSGILTAVCDREDGISEEIANDKNIFPDSATFNRLFLGSPCSSMEDLEYEKKSTEAWNYVRLNIPGPGGKE